MSVCTGNTVALRLDGSETVEHIIQKVASSTSLYLERSVMERQTLYHCGVALERKRVPPLLEGARLQLGRLIPHPAHVCGSCQNTHAVEFHDPFAAHPLSTAVAWARERVHGLRGPDQGVMGERHHKLAKYDLIDKQVIMVPRSLVVETQAAFWASDLQDAGRWSGEDWVEVCEFDVNVPYAHGVLNFCEHLTKARPSLIPTPCTRFTRAGIEWRR